MNFTRILTLFFLFFLNMHLAALEETDKKPKFKAQVSGLLDFSTKIPIEVENPENLTSFNQPERNIKIEQEKTLPWGKLFSALLAITILLIVKSLPKSKDNPVNLVKTAKEKAVLKLELLEPKKLGSQEIFYSELSDILRSYIEDRYQIKALKQTSEEFLLTIEQNPTQFPEVELSKFLTLSDKVKFAKMSPSITECSTGYELVKQIIEN